MALTPSVTAKGYNKIIFGKTFWKGVALPTLMQNTEAITFTNKETECIQIEENKAYRYIAVTNVDAF